MFVVTISIACSAKEISQRHFNHDLYNIFGITIYKLNDGDVVDYKFGKDIDSLSIYYDLIKGYNDQYLLYISKELPDIDQSLYKKILDRPALLKKMIFEQIISDSVFKARHTNVVAYYLLGKGVKIQGYKYKKRPKFSYENYFKVCSMFFYIYDYDSTGFHGKICGGINPFLKENIKADPYLEAFTFTALIKILLVDREYFAQFDRVIKRLDNEAIIKNLNGNNAISFGKQAMYESFFHNRKLRAQMLTAYRQAKNILPFTLYE